MRGSVMNSIKDTGRRLHSPSKNALRRRASRALPDWRPRTREAAFTLIELMYVIIIIGILVGIAVPVYMGLARNAEEAVAAMNERSFSELMNVIFFDLFEEGVQIYRDPTPPEGLVGNKEVDAQYCSYLDPKSQFVEMEVQGGRWRITGIWKNKQLIASGPDNYYNWDLLYGRIGILQDWFYWDSGQWNPNAHREYVFTLTVSKTSQTARYTQFYMGGIDLSGEFAWQDGNGAPSR